jgi:hypothetical protein
MTQHCEPPTPTTTPASSAQPPRLLDQLRAAARAAGHPEPTVAAFAAWDCTKGLWGGGNGKGDPLAPLAGTPATAASDITHVTVLWNYHRFPDFSNSRRSLLT